MKWILAAGVLGGIGWWGYAWWTQEDDQLSPKWLAQHGMYDGYARSDPDDPSTLERLRSIARAQQPTDQDLNFARRKPGP